jgi:PhnB protein
LELAPRAGRGEQNFRQHREQAMQVQPYLDFNGRCDEALEFYKNAIDAKVGMTMRWKDSPDKTMCTPQNADKIMHTQFSVGDTTVMASDGRNSGQPTNFTGIMLCITAENEAKADKLFNALAEGGKVAMPMGKTFFAPRFGMVADKFGVGWMIIVAH